MIKIVLQTASVVALAIFVFQYIETTKQVNLVHDKLENEIQSFKQASFLNQYYDVNIVTITVIDKIGITVTYVLRQIFDLGCLIFLIFSTPFLFMVTALGPFLPFLIILQMLQN